MPISFSCSGCGQAYKVPDESAGRSTKCRKCGTLVSIPTTSSIAAQPAAPRPAADAFNFAGHDSPDTTPRPKTKKKSKKGLMLALFGVLFAFFGCCLLPGTAGVAYYFFFLGGDEGMKYLPDNPQVIMSTRTRNHGQRVRRPIIKKGSPMKGIHLKLNEITADTGLKRTDTTEHGGIQRRHQGGPAWPS